MASLSSSVFGLLSATLFQNSPILSVPSNPFAVSQNLSFSISSSSSSSCPAAKKSPGLKHRHCSSRASSLEGVPSELVEESKFVPLNADDSAYGPPVLLLMGFAVEEDRKIRQFLKDLDGEFLEVVYCTEDMIARSLWEAVHTRQPNLEAVKYVYVLREDKMADYNTVLKPTVVSEVTETTCNKHEVAESLPRICVFSGLTGEEIMMFIDAFPETGLEPAVFAAMVPNSAEKALEELIEEIMGDHEMLAAKQSGSTEA